MTVADDGVVGQIDLQIIVLDTFDPFPGSTLGCGGFRFCRLITAQHGTDAGNQLFGIKWFHDIVVGAQFQTEHLVKDFSFCG